MCAALSNESPRFLPMSVANTGFLLDRLGEDCHPLQYLRELTQNAIEAIKRTGMDGKIVWDVDWHTYDLAEKPIFKLSVTDTGDGMSGEELERFINQLSSSTSEQSFSGNYGVGAKIAAATRNPWGVIYISWKNGEGSMIHLERNTEGQYGLRQWRREDGTYSHYVPVDDDIKPDIINQHGTKVVLLGESPNADTMKAIPGTASPSRWIAKYLNSRYFVVPDSIELRARQGWENPRSDSDNNVLRKLTGQREYLEQHKIDSGAIPLSNATAHWWILKDEKALSSNSGHIESAGHVAALYQDELYEIESGRGGMSKLQHFGILFGYRQVVIYIEPAEGSGRLTTNTARTHLSVNKNPLPWSEWALEFRQEMPDNLYAFVQEKGRGATSTDHSKSIRERLKDILNLYKLSKYRPSPSGEYFISDDELTDGGASASRNQSTSTSSSSSASSSGGGGSDGNIYAIFEKKQGTPAKRSTPDPFPQVVWISKKDGTRESGFLEDRAAKYLADQNLLQINADFRVFTDMNEFWTTNFESSAGVEETVSNAARNWFEQALVETVIGVQSLRNSKEWTTAEIEHALSPEALSAAVMQRYHINVAVRRELGSKLGKLQKAMASTVSQ